MRTTRIPFGYFIREANQFDSVESAELVAGKFGSLENKSFDEMKTDDITAIQNELNKEISAAKADNDDITAKKLTRLQTTIAGLCVLREHKESDVELKIDSDDVPVASEVKEVSFHTEDEGDRVIKIASEDCGETPPEVLELCYHNVIGKLYTLAQEFRSVEKLPDQLRKSKQASALQNFKFAVDAINKNADQEGLQVVEQVEEKEQATSKPVLRVGHESTTEQQDRLYCEEGRIDQPGQAFMLTVVSQNEFNHLPEDKKAEPYLLYDTGEIVGCHSDGEWKLSSLEEGVVIPRGWVGKKVHFYNNEEEQVGDEWREQNKEKCVCDNDQIYAAVIKGHLAHKVINDPTVARVLPSEREDDIEYLKVDADIFVKDMLPADEKGKAIDWLSEEGLTKKRNLVLKYAGLSENQVIHEDNVDEETRNDVLKTHFIECWRDAQIVFKTLKTEANQIEKLKKSAKSLEIAWFKANKRLIEINPDFFEKLHPEIYKSHYSDGQQEPKNVVRQKYRRRCAARMGVTAPEVVSTKRKRKEKPIIRSIAPKRNIVETPLTLPPVESLTSKTRALLEDGFNSLNSHLLTLRAGQLVTLNTIERSAEEVKNVVHDRADEILVTIHKNQQVLLQKLEGNEKKFNELLENLPKKHVKESEEREEKNHTIKHSPELRQHKKIYAKMLSELLDYAEAITLRDEGVELKQESFDKVGDVIEGISHFIPSDFIQNVIGKLLTGARAIHGARERGKLKTLTNTFFYDRENLIDDIATQTTLFYQLQIEVLDPASIMEFAYNNRIRFMHGALAVKSEDFWKLSPKEKTARGIEMTIEGQSTTIGSVKLKTKVSQLTGYTQNDVVRCPLFRKPKTSQFFMWTASKKEREKAVNNSRATEQKAMQNFNQFGYCEGELPLDYFNSHYVPIAARLESTRWRAIAHQPTQEQPKVAQGVKTGSVESGDAKKDASNQQKEPSQAIEWINADKDGRHYVQRSVNGQPINYYLEPVPGDVSLVRLVGDDPNTIYKKVEQLYDDGKAYHALVKHSVTLQHNATVVVPRGTTATSSSWPVTTPVLFNSSNRVGAIGLGQSFQTQNNGRSFTG